MDITKAKELACEIAGLLTALDNNLISSDCVENVMHKAGDKANQLAQLFVADNEADVIIAEMLENAESEVIEQEESVGDETDEQVAENIETAPIITEEEDNAEVEAMSDDEIASDEETASEEIIAVYPEYPADEVLPEIEESDEIDETDVAEETDAVEESDALDESEVTEDPEEIEVPETQDEEYIADETPADAPQSENVATDLNESVFMRTKVSSISKAFTLNDKFRFKRELFGNSDPEFSNALDLISVMRSIDEAEDYFYNELGWDAENEDVKDFMRIVRAYFLNRQ